jgi:hypothetical protein
MSLLCYRWGPCVDDKMHRERCPWFRTLKPPFGSYNSPARVLYRFAKAVAIVRTFKGCGESMHEGELVERVAREAFEAFFADDPSFDVDRFRKECEE